METSNSRRILAVSLESQTAELSRVVKGKMASCFAQNLNANHLTNSYFILGPRSVLTPPFSELTGKVPTSPTDSLAGTTHPLPLTTPYYSTTVPIWLDLVASPSEWSASFLSDEAKEVLDVLGGIIVVFAIPPSTTGPKADETRSLIREVGKIVKDGLGGWDWDGVGIAVGVSEETVEDEEWDEVCAEGALEFVRVGGKQVEKNEFGGSFISSRSHTHQQRRHSRDKETNTNPQRKPAPPASKKPSKQTTGPISPPRPSPTAAPPSATSPPPRTTTTSKTTTRTSTLSTSATASTASTLRA